MLPKFSWAGVCGRLQNKLAKGGRVVSVNPPERLRRSFALAALVLFLVTGGAPPDARLRGRE
jgi:hypothetical protein